MLVNPLHQSWVGSMIGSRESITSLISSMIRSRPLDLVDSVIVNPIVNQINNMHLKMIEVQNKTEKMPLDLIDDQIEDRVLCLHRCPLCLIGGQKEGFNHDRPIRSMISIPKFLISRLFFVVAVAGIKLGTIHLRFWSISMVHNQWIFLGLLLISCLVLLGKEYG